MTDEKIIEALAYCVSTKSCEECPICNTDNCGFVLMRNAFDLIERQQVEIEDLKADKEAIVNGQLTLQKMYLKCRDKAVREFENKILELFPSDKNFTTISRFTIKQITKEMTEEKK